MSDDVSGQVAQQLSDVGPAVAVALEFPVEKYFEVLRGLVEEFAKERKIDCIYISAAVPATTIQATFDALEMDSGSTSFIDCISQMTMGPQEKGTDRFIYVESPTFLENVVLKVQYLMRKLGEGPKLVVVDSVNALSFHNDTKILSEFLHILISGLSSKDAYPVILSMKESLRPEVHEMLALVCDQVITLEGPE
ncbi:hypothetical protein [Methanomassiliicoccus luminyensis]|jgi:KaiC/GvpD/RAD55 family RecA-like ATPase|uniref:hypothetical protein n=1 Tax=Methanomassiliicoccus luminyensis TaxID=1080712 RepID=UPI00036BD810|nr:hypothetical protein [Methanomassiliicoccus luminyensis]